MPRHRAALFVAPALAVTLLAFGCSSGAKKPARKTTTTTSTSTTSTTSTTAPVAPTAVAPLTGVPVGPDQGANVARPALAIKIDNSTDGLPQSGVNSTDIVFEIQVEGISRLMAVFQSQDSAKIGPTRSARYSDPPILAMFGHPLFGWSGANKGVEKAVYGSPWIVNVNWDSVPSNQYRRSSDRKAPHNLYTDSKTLYTHTPPGDGPPPAVFQYLAAGQSNATATPLAGLNEMVGTTPSQWVWNAPAGDYLRWEYGQPHGTDAGQVTATNVVVLATQYQSGPVAVTTGTGQAIVLTGGTAISGTWSRAQNSAPYTLTAVDGTPIELNPGRTWVELPNHPWGPIDPNTAAGLLAGAK